MIKGSRPRCKSLERSTLASSFGKWTGFAFLTFAVGVTAATLLRGFPTGGSIIPEAGTVVETPTLCASMPVCHVGGSTLNQFGGVAFLDLPATYFPGTQYDLGLQITGTLSTRLYGFQLAVFFENSQKQAGTLAPVSAGVQMIEFGGLQLLTHIQPLESGVVQFRWTAPATPQGRVVFRVAANAANGNNSTTGDHINTRQATVEAGQISDDADGDGVKNSVEAQAPNGGDGNNDGIPDSSQPHVASFPDFAGSGFVTLEAPATLTLTEVAPLDNPSPQDSPLGVDFPILFFRFNLNGLPMGETGTVRMLFSDQVPQNSFFQYGTNSENPTPHWQDFAYDGTTGAEIRQNEVLLHFREGERGDSTPAAAGIAALPMGPGLQRGVFYFPQIGLGQIAGSSFRTDLVFVNTRNAAFLQVDFFDSTGAPFEAPLLISGVASGPASSFQRTLGAGESIRVRLSDASPLRAGYARIIADAGIGGTAVFTQTDLGSGATLYDAGVPATAPLRDFSLAVGVDPGKIDTGLALVNASPSSGVSVAEAVEARITLRLYDDKFGLVAAAETTLGPGQHLPRFLTQFFEPLAQTETEFFGTVTVESDQPVAAVTLQQTTVPTLTAFPVIPGRADRQKP